MIVCKRAVSRFIYTLAFALQLRSTENLSDGSRAVLGTARSQLA
jgi:hypothetical protein